VIKNVIKEKIMHFERRFTTSGQDAYANIEFRSATSEIRNPDGTIVFQAENIEVQAQFSQVATDILAQKYFAKRCSCSPEAD
jgi:ribonucleoside-diphosphate reductase alpha chain